MGKLLNGEECQILLDTGASKLYMSKSYYLRCKALHDLPKFASKHKEFKLEMVSMLEYCLLYQLSLK